MENNKILVIADKAKDEAIAKQSENYYGMKAEIREDGLCYFEDGRIFDLSQPKEE